MKQSKVITFIGNLIYSFFVITATIIRKGEFVEDIKSIF